MIHGHIQKVHMSKFQERLQWLKRMPMKWRILFGTQLIFFTTALSYRLKDISNARLKSQQVETNNRETKEETR